MGGNEKKKRAGPPSPSTIGVRVAEGEPSRARTPLGLTTTTRCYGDVRFGEEKGGACRRRRRLMD